MDEEFLDYYNRELQYLQEKGRNFALRHPNAAHRLMKDTVAVEDPYVEQFLDGLAYLSARIKLKMDAEYPNFVQNIMEVVYPGFCNPVPSVGIVQIEPNPQASSNCQSFGALPKGTLLRSSVQDKACRFTTTSTLQMLPLAVSKASFSEMLPALPENIIALQPLKASIKGILQVECTLTEPIDPDRFNTLDALQFYLNGEPVYTYKLLEMLFSGCNGVLLKSIDADEDQWCQFISAEAIIHDSFSELQALLPADPRVFEGDRLISEYFSCPAKFLFFSIHGLSEALETHLGKQAGSKFELVFLFNIMGSKLAGNITKETLKLNCVPIINLFPKHIDSVPVDDRKHEYHVVADRNNPLDYEIYDLLSVSSLEPVTQKLVSFRRIYDVLWPEQSSRDRFYSLRRETRLPSDIALRDGPRSNYLGSEVFISLVDKNQPALSHALSSLDIVARCTNRDLPLGVNINSSISCPNEPDLRVIYIKLPTRPRPAINAGAIPGNLVSRLSHNFLKLLQSDAQSATEAFKQLLMLSIAPNDTPMLRQVQGIVSIHVRPTTNRFLIKGSIAYARGVIVIVTVDEEKFAGLSPYLLGSVIYQYLIRHTSINTDLEFHLYGVEAGRIARWKPSRQLRQDIGREVYES